MAAITLKDIAQECNLSRAAVSQVLRNPDHPEFPEETRRRVISAAQKLHYVPSRLPSQLRDGTTNLLSLILPWNVTELMDTAERVANQLGFEVMIHFTPQPDPIHQEKAFLAALSWRVDGIVWMPAGFENSFAQKVVTKAESNGAKLVLLENSIEGNPNIDVVMQDDLETCRMAVDHLVEKGYRKLVFVTTGTGDAASQRRAQDFVQCTANVSPPSEVIRQNPETGAEEAVYKYLLGNNDWPIGFFSENDWLGIDVVHAARRAGRNIPSEVGLVSLGDTMIGGRFHMGQLISPSITAIYRPFGEMARIAIQTLVERVKNKNVKESANGLGRKIIVAQGLVERESTARM